MLLLVSGATRTVAEYPEVGTLIVPMAKNRPDALRLDARRWAMDNGAFNGFKPGPFMTMLEAFHAAHRASPCLFVVVPDVVGNAAETLRRWPFWSTVVRACGYPAAFVAQDGQTLETVPWDEMAALFIGGTTAFKLGPMARTLAGYAKARGLWVHVGRVNSHRRMRYVAQIGGDSFDGTSTSKYAKVHIPRRLRSAERIRRQPELVL